MSKIKNPVIDEKNLSKKYRANVTFLIKAWKQGRSDMEIAEISGVDLYTLRQIKSDIELAYSQNRLARKKDSPINSSFAKQRQIFLNPWT